MTRRDKGGKSLGKGKPLAWKALSSTESSYFFIRLNPTNNIIQFFIQPLYIFYVAVIYYAVKTILVF